MTKAIPFTAASLARAIKAAQVPGMSVATVGVDRDGHITITHEPTVDRPVRGYDLERSAAYCRSNPSQFMKLVEVGLFPRSRWGELWSRKDLDRCLEAATPETRPGGGHIYFAAVEKFIKIGFSGDVHDRIAKMQTGSPFEIELLAYVRGTEAAEHNLHLKFWGLHHRGEWFRSDPGLLAYIDWLQGRP